MESRIIELELRFMDQQSTIQELNEVLISQQKELGRLREELDLLKQQMKVQTPSLTRDPSQETPPPHY